MLHMHEQHQALRSVSKYPSRADKQASLSMYLNGTMMNGHSALVKHLAFSPDGDLLATCGYD
jgi:WD40 repeat protein